MMRMLADKASRRSTGSWKTMMRQADRSRVRAWFKADLPSVAHLSEGRVSSTGESTGLQNEGPGSWPRPG